MNTRRSQLLAHYADKDPRMFVQFDAFDPPTCPFDGFADEDGQEFFVRVTHELMHGATVRVLVPPGTDPSVARQLLVKIADWIARDGLTIHTRPFYGEAPF
jgi:hypothetical protein